MAAEHLARELASQLAGLRDGALRLASQGASLSRAPPGFSEADIPDFPGRSLIHKYEVAWGEIERRNGVICQKSKDIEIACAAILAGFRTNLSHWDALNAELSNISLLHSELLSINRTIEDCVRNADVVNEKVENCMRVADSVNETVVERDEPLIKVQEKVVEEEEEEEEEERLPPEVLQDEEEPNVEYVQ